MLCINGLRQLETIRFLYVSVEARNNDKALGVDPGAIFGISPEDLKDILQSLALQFEDYIRVSFQVNLDNVILFREKTALSVLDLALQREE